MAQHKVALTAYTAVVVAFLAITVFALPADSEEKEFFRIGTGSVKGVYLPVANRLCERINASGELHGYRCGVAATPGSGTNIEQVLKGDIKFAFAQSDFTMAASSERGVTNMATVFTLHVEPIHVVVRKNSGIADFTDLKQKRINVGEQGSGSISVVQPLLNVVGLKENEYEPTFFGPSIQSEMLCRGKTDTVFWVAGIGNLSIAEAFSICDVELLSLSEKMVGRILSSTEGLEKSIIPAGTYVGQTRDVASIGPRAKLVTVKSTNRDLVSLLVAAIVDEFGNIRNIHPSLVGLELTSLTSGAASEVWHPAATEQFENFSRD